MNENVNVNANEVIKSLINKLATAQYENAVLEAKLSETLKENEELKKGKGDK
ncbi:hypothetical protein [Limosilactobacillus mucosae]|uniref:hypothetical protein n=1 Tax=Limosilactobacillus mucosae TaxID=97478 RepID=UPI0022E48C04|nr:hypothetical protein [Limosilactobacillus mucosae]